MHIEARMRSCVLILSGKDYFEVKHKAQPYPKIYDVTVERRPESRLYKAYGAVRRIFQRASNSNHEMPPFEKSIDPVHQRGFRPPPITMEELTKPIQIIDQHGELKPAE